MLLSLKQNWTLWTQQDWVDAAQIVSSAGQVLSAVLTLVTVFFAYSQIKQARKDAQPEVTIYIAEDRRSFTIDIILTNVKSVPVFVKTFVLRYFDQAGRAITIGRQQLLRKGYINPYYRVYDPQSLLGMGNTYKVTLHSHCLKPSTMMSETSHIPLSAAARLRKIFTRLIGMRHATHHHIAELRFITPGVHPDPTVYFYAVIHHGQTMNYWVYAATRKLKSYDDIEQVGILVATYEVPSYREKVVKFN
ncbi:hypothetical protein [Polycladomyces subterraneus]|uniref:Uncharacterized protein n=1 Tax=Polycladomyces subterraneus TaxID=1016997 RepID=A0ABT8IRK2_9BACL|nr:hypothetical protein [Polycladomyces subterraneus]MDN4595436.1 hypothetical protein [Polycladomyces subterraneus]